MALNTRSLPDRLRIVTSRVVCSPERRLADRLNGLTSIRGGSRLSPVSSMIRSGSSGSLVVIRTDPAEGPGATGRYSSSTARLSSRGITISVTEDVNSSPVTSIAIVMLRTPTLPMLKVRIAVSPTKIRPNSSASTSSSRSGAGSTDNTTGTPTVESPGTLLRTKTSDAKSPPSWPEASKTTSTSVVAPTETSPNRGTASSHLGAKCSVARKAFMMRSASSSSM